MRPWGGPSSRGIVISIRPVSYPLYVIEPHSMILKKPQAQGDFCCEE